MASKKTLTPKYTVPKRALGSEDLQNAVNEDSCIGKHRK